MGLIVKSIIPQKGIQGEMRYFLSEKASRNNYAYFAHQILRYHCSHNTLVTTLGVIFRADPLMATTATANSNLAIRPLPAPKAFKEFKLLIRITPSQNIMP